MRSKLYRAVTGGRDLIRSTTATVEGALEALEGLYKMCPWMERIPMAREDGADQGTLRGQDVVRAILESAPGKWWTLTLLAREVEDRDWSPMSHNALRMAADRVVANDPDHYFKDTGTKTGAATYSYRPFATSDPNGRHGLAGSLGRSAMDDLRAHISDMEVQFTEEDLKG